ncbi:hypothetical protein ACFCZ3_20330 [Cellulosimicrobium cellulans]|uniref:hypothetical protein n=1 Tax=Cellulosimicrobium cellulans TaxID=1710 RepID=UPI0035E10127
MTTRARTTKTLRLGDAAQAALDRIVAAEDTSANTAIERAVLEYDSKRREAREVALERIVTRREGALSRLD